MLQRAVTWFQPRLPASRLGTHATTSTHTRTSLSAATVRMPRPNVKEGQR